MKKGRICSGKNGVLFEVSYEMYKSRIYLCKTEEIKPAHPPDFSWEHNAPDFHPCSTLCFHHPPTGTSRTSSLGFPRARTRPTE